MFEAIECTRTSPIYLRCCCHAPFVSDTVSRPTCLFLHVLHDHYTLRAFCEFQQAHAHCAALHSVVRSDASYTDCTHTSIHACLHSTRRIDAHATRDISFFMIHPQHSLSGLSGQHIHYVHIPAFTSFILSADWTNGTLAYISDACAFL